MNERENDVKNEKTLVPVFLTLMAIVAFWHISNNQSVESVTVNYDSPSETSPCYPNMMSELEDLLVKYQVDLIVGYSDGWPYPALIDSHGNDTGIKFINGYMFKDAKDQQDKRNPLAMCH